MTMTDTEAKAREVIRSIGATMLASTMGDSLARSCAYELERALEREARHAAELREQAERFSEVLVAIRRKTVPQRCHDAFDELAAPFIIPAPDPLVEVFDDCFHQNVEEGETWSQAMARKTRAAIQARGGKIVWEAK